MTDQIFTNCTVGGPISVHVKDGRIVRVRPLKTDEKDLKPWTIEAKGKSFSPPKKFGVAPFTLAERTRVYAEDRIKYPMKRRDFDPSGDRNPENRGKSGYERITWDEAIDIISKEMKRIRDDYGPAAISAMTSSHHNWGIVGYKLGAFMRFFNMIGFTQVFDNPDSWEGFHWGAAHAYGFNWRLGAPEQYDLLEDALKNTELIIHWANDPDSTHGAYCGNESAIWRLWLKELGIKQIFIDPFCNYTAGILADKWIPLKPDGGDPIALAIAYVWIKEDSYDRDYVATHTIGFEEFRKYVTGEEDGQPKTPEWAEKKSGVSARTIATLAREWASKRTMLACGTEAGFGGAGKQAYSHEWSRFMVFLIAMQGLGKPGVGLWGTTKGAPRNNDFYFPGYGEPEGMIFLTPAANKTFHNPVKQRLYRLLLPDSVLNPPVHWRGEGFCAKSLDQQFIPYTYPMPEHPEIRMLYRYGSSFVGTMTDTNKWVEMYQSPKLEFIVNQDCWTGSETNFADIILPACTNLERVDIGEWALAGGYVPDGDSGCNYRVIVFEQKCIEPLYESKSDYEIFTLISDRLGMMDDFTDGGKTEEDWCKALFDLSDVPGHMSWEDFKEKGYFIVPVGEDHKPTPSFRWFYEGRECDTPDLNPLKGTEKAKNLGTYSGKIEFVSESLKANLPDDRERPPMPRYIPSWEGQESELYKKYPLQLITPHPRFSFHTHHDKHVAWLGEIPGHRILKDGYYWWVLRMNPADAQARGIQNNDIVKVYNDRAAVLCIVQVTGRMMLGVVHSYGSGGKYDPLEPGKPGSIDKGGCVNLLTSGRMMSKNAAGMAPNSCLVEISKWEI